MKWTPRPVFWACWLVGIALTFAVPEYLALSGHGGTTLSSFMWQTTLSWPLWEFIWGLLIGGLAVHFWWHWNPPGQIRGTGG